LSSTVLLIEDEDVMRQTLADVFSQGGYQVFACARALEAEEIFLREVVDCILMDLRLPDRSGLDLFQQFHAANPRLPVLLMTAYPDTRAAVQAIKEGAFDYVSKPFELSEVKLAVAKACEYARLQNEVERLRSQSRVTADLVGQCEVTKRMLALVSKVAASRDTPVLLRGESGAGKELVAGRIHALSPRAAGPMVCLNCSAIPDGLFEAELFGYEKGACTFFLDEVVELPLAIQPKLLRVLEGSAFRRVGGLRDLRVDVRVVAASNADLKEAVKSGRFRDDLYFRLNVFEIHVPPLRDRREDIPLIAEHLLAMLSAAMGRRPASITPEALRALTHYSWPGNVRELRNVIERALILTEDDQVRPEDLPEELRQVPVSPRSNHSLETAKRRHILSVMEQCGQNRTKAAQLLEISRSTLKELLRNYGVARDPDERA
jgi:DNA-binding NtrC family response regulator